MIYSFSGLMGKMNFISFLNFWIASTLTLILHWNALEKKQNFLDVTVELSNNQFVTDLYCYPTDSHQYLHYNFWHLEQMKKSSVYIQGLHIKQLCSDETFLSNYLKDLRSWFCKRGYPEIMVKEQLRRVENRIRDELSSYPNRCVGKMVGVSMLLTIHTLMVWIKWCRKILHISKPTRPLNCCLHYYLLYHFVQCITSKVI